MLQLLYVSSVVPGAAAVDPASILAVSRANNRRDSITGLLYSDGKRFLQVLEGPQDKVTSAFARIKLDSRHRAIVVLSERAIDVPEFGEWDMAHRAPGDETDAFLQRLDVLVNQTSPNVRATFEGFAKIHRGA